MSITRASGFPVQQIASITSISVTWVTAGDLAVFSAGVGSSTTARVTGISSSKSSGWAEAGFSTDSTDTQDQMVWTGKVTGTGADTITITWNANPAVGNEMLVDEFTAGLGSTTVWTVVTYGGARTTNSLYPQLTSGPGSTQIYWGYVSTLAAGSSNPTAGFTYFTTPTYGNEIAFNGGLSANTSYQPGTNTSNSTLFGTSVIVAASLPLPVGVATFVGQGSTPHGQMQVSSSPTVTQGVRRAGYY